MKKINYIDILENKIQLLEAEQAVKVDVFKKQVYITYESFKPINLLKKSFNDVMTSPSTLDTLISTGLSLATGYLSKKIVIGNSGNILRKIIGSLLQVGVTKVVAQNADTIKSIGQIIFQNIFRKKEVNNEDYEG